MSLFGSNKPATGGGLFGSGASTTPGTPSGGGLFGGAATSTPATGGGLFGGASTSTPATGGGLFGGASTTPAGAPPSGGLFESTTPAATSAPATGGLFGTTSAATTSAPATGGLFGTANTTATSSAPATGGLFGNTTAAAAAPAKPSLFGSMPAATSTGGGLFGAATSTQPSTAPATTTTTGGGLFGGASTTTPAAGTSTGGGLFGGGATSTFGGTQQQQQMVPAATIDFSKLTATTRFSDCHPNVQLTLESIEAEIQEQIALAEKIKAAFPAHREAVETIPTDVSVLSNRLASTKSFQHSDQMAYEQVRAAHQEDEEASKLSIRTLDLFAIPHAQRSQYMRSSSFATPQRENDVVGNKPMIAYFNKQANEMEHKMEIVKRVVRQVEESLQSVESQAIQSAREVAAVGGQDRAALTGGVTGRQDAKRLNNVLREFNDALKGVSGRVADAREGLEALKQKR